MTGPLRPQFFLLQTTTFQFNGSSDSQKCHDAVLHLFDFDEKCEVPDQCTFNGVYQPPVNGQFMVCCFEMKFIGLD